MPFQSVVSEKQGFGIPGEFYLDSPQVVTNQYILDSADADNNVFGRYFSIKPAQNILCEAGAPTATAQAQVTPGGILVNPKVYANQGTAASTLAPSFVLPNGKTAALCTRGLVIVEILTTSSVGWIVIVNRTNGTLQTIPPTATNVPENFFLIGASVALFPVTTNGGALAVIDLNTTAFNVPPFTP